MDEREHMVDDRFDRFGENPGEKLEATVEKDRHKHRVAHHVIQMYLVGFPKTKEIVTVEGVRQK